MPQTIKVKTSSGATKFSYVISTPDQPEAKAIDPNLPTVLFIHPVYIAQNIWQPQFSDCALRKFNLVALDLRAHGETGGQVPKDYDQVDAAKDISKFMEALKLPPCYLAGLSMGTIIAIQVAVSYPDIVKGLILFSPLGTEEPEEVAEGRQEIYESWVPAFQDKKKPDMEAIQTSISGALMLGFSATGPNGEEIKHQSNLSDSLIEILKPQALKHWAPSSSEFKSCHTATVKFFTARKSHPTATLAKIKGPVLMVHFIGDVAYPLEYTEVFHGQLKDAGVKVDLKTVEGAPHFGPTTHPKQVNSIVFNWLCKVTGKSFPEEHTSVKSPFEPILLANGWDPEDDEDGLILGVNGMRV